MSHLSLAALGAIVPHAPLLLPEVSPGAADSTTTVRAALASIDLNGFDGIFLISPHGDEAGVYARVEGSLEDFGVDGANVRCATDEALAAALAERWRRPLLHDPCDHGVVVPLSLLHVPVPVVACTFTEVSAGVDEVLADAGDLAPAVRAVARDARVAVVASVNTSTALSDRAPFTRIEEAVAIEREVVDAITTDVGRLRALAPRIAIEGRSCGAGPVRVLAELFSGEPMEVLAHEHPYGVGYVVAASRRR